MSYQTQLRVNTIWGIKHIYKLMLSELSNTPVGYWNLSYRTHFYNNAITLKKLSIYMRWCAIVMKGFWKANVWNAYFWKKIWLKNFQYLVGTNPAVVRRRKTLTVSARCMFCLNKPMLDITWNLSSCLCRRSHMNISLEMKRPR